MTSSIVAYYIREMFNSPKLASTKVYNTVDAGSVDSFMLIKR